MDDWLKAQLAHGFPAFAGSSLSGTLSVRQELMTELLTELLRHPTPASGGSELGSLMKFVQEVAVRADAGAVLLDFKIAV